MASLDPLVTTDWLGDQLHADELRVVDCRFHLDAPDRGRSEYLRGHIPTARYLSLDDDLTGDGGPGRHPLPPAAGFAAKLARLGIGDGHTVVVYDSDDGSIAARLWWMLRSLGHPATYVLDGGWAAWLDMPGSQTAEVPEWPEAVFTASTEWTGVIDRDGIVRRRPELLLVDARRPARFAGDEEPIDPVAGHIPGAINVPYAGNTDDSGRFLDAVELRDRFRLVDQADTVVCYCGSGVTACSNLLALARAGWEDVLLYPGSWSDWCTSGGDIGRE